MTPHTAEDSYFNLSVYQSYSFFYVAKWQYLLFQGHRVIAEFMGWMEDQKSRTEGQRLLLCLADEICCCSAAQGAVLSTGPSLGFAFSYSFLQVYFWFLSSPLLADSATVLLFTTPCKCQEVFTYDNGRDLSQKW